MCMCQLLDAIYSLSQRDWFDYLSVIAPSVLSGVAIWISVSTARKQNKIALFEINYAALHQIRAILEFAEATVLCENKRHVAIQMDSFFKTGLELELNSKGWSHVFAIINQIEKKALTKSLFRTEYEEKKTRRLIAELRLLMLCVYANPDEINLEELSRFRKQCSKFGNKIYGELEKRVRI